MDTTYNKTKTEEKDMDFNSVAIPRKSIRDYFLDEKDEIEEAQIFYPSYMNNEPKPESTKESQAFFIDKSQGLHSPILPKVKEYVEGLNPLEETPSPFIVANTLDVSLSHLHTDCITNDIPDVIERFLNRAKEDRARTEPSFVVPKKEIADNGYDLSINKYKEVEYEQKTYAKPVDIWIFRKEVNLF